MGEYGKISIIVRKIILAYSIVNNDIVYRRRLQVRRCIGMSKMMYAVLSCMGVLVLIMCDIQCIKRRTELGRRVAELLSIGALSVAGYTIIFLSSDYKWMSAGNCIFFAGMDWLCYAMFLYTIEYTKYKGKALFDLKPWMKLVTVIILTIDSVSMLCNIVLEHAMKFMEKSKNTKRSADIVQMVVAMADKLGMPVIAEGVETKEQADFLGRIGCDIIQGYYYAKPMSMEEFEQLLNKYPYRDIVQKGIGNDI